MKQSRCIFCMSRTDRQEQVCPVCKKGIWEYQWKETYLEPYTRLYKKYMIGAALEDKKGTIRYMGYDLVLDQKVLIYAYDSELWEEKKERGAALLFGRFTLSGITAVKDYFKENGGGYMVTSFAEGITLEEYLKVHGRIPEERTVQMLIPVIRAVNSLHAAGIIHGNIAPENVIVSEEGNLCLLTDCSGYIRERSRDDDGQENSSEIQEEYKKFCVLEEECGDAFTAPEQLEEEGIQGPWTDVYALGAVWYEMITGHRPENAGQRRKKDTLKRPSRYTEVSQKTEKALMQAMSPDPQMRFFYLGNLLESMKLPREEVEREAGTIRHIWGEAWLETAGRTREQRKKGRFQGYLWKRLTAAGIALIFLAGAGMTGLYAYIRTHQPEYFGWKLEQARKKTDTRADEGIYEKEDPKYEEIKEFILKYGEAEEIFEDQSERRNTYYELEEDDLRYCPAEHSAAEKFYLDYRTVKEAVQYYMGIQGKMDLSQTSFYGSGCIDNNEEAAIAVYLNKTETYKVRTSGDEIEFNYDPLDKKLLDVQYQGSRQNCIRFLNKMLPLLTPETFLTEEEAAELMTTVTEEGDYKFLFLNARYQIHISHEEDFQDGDEKIYSVKVNSAESLYRSWYGFYLDHEEDDTVYAGNYERGSGRYEEFITYVKEHAVSEKEAETEADTALLDSKGALIYTLEEKDVLEWGEPCNNFRFFIKADELVKELKKMGYQMRKISEKRENTVEIQKYGAVLTYFGVVEHYQMEDEICLAVVKDLVNEDVLQMLVYREEGSDVLINTAAEDAAEAAGLGEQLSGEEEKELAADILEMEKETEEEGETRYLVIGNTTFMNAEYKNTGIGTYIVPAGRFDGQPYYWTQTGIE